MIWWIGEFVVSFFWCHEQVNNAFLLQSKQESTTWSEPASEQSGFVDASLEAPKSPREFSLSTSYLQLFSRKLRKVPSQLFCYLFKKKKKRRNPSTNSSQLIGFELKVRQVWCKTWSTKFRCFSIAQTSAHYWYGYRSYIRLIIRFWGSKKMIFLTYQNNFLVP